MNPALTRTPEAPFAFLWTAKSLLDAAGLVPGDPVELRLRLAPADAVNIPEDLAVALRTAGRTAAWEAMTPGRRRAALRIATLLTCLEE